METAVSDLKVVGITGSSGKTTAKGMIDHLLRDLGSVLSTEGNLNNEIGVPMTLCQLTGDHQFAVIEMGARKEGDIAFLASIAQPDVGVVLNIGTAHVGEFGGVEILRRTKQEMYTSTNESMVAVAPGDDPVAVECASSHHKNVVTFGKDAQDLVRITNAQAMEDGHLILDLVVGKEPVSIDFPVYHRAYPINIAAACAMAHGLGVNASDMKRGLEKFSSIPGRYRITTSGSWTIVDDTYNANPQSMEMGINSVSESFNPKDTMFVLGDMLELGEESEPSHYKTGQICGSLSPKALVLVGEFSQAYRKGAIASGLPEDQIFIFPTVEILLEKFSELPSCDTVFAKGSRGAKLDLFINHLHALGN